MSNKHGADLFFLQLRSKEYDEAGTPPSTQEDANDLKTSHSPQAKLLTVLSWISSHLYMNL